MTKTKNSKKQSKIPSKWELVRELKATEYPDMPILRQIYNQIETRRVRGQQELSTVVVPYDQTVFTDGSGNLQSVFSNDPNNSTVYWPLIQANFDSYRVLGIKATYFPLEIIGGSTATVRAPIAVVTDYDDPTTLTSYTLAESYSDHSRHRPNLTFSKFACESATETTWNTSMNSSPTNPLYIKMFSAGGTAATQLGRVRVEYIVQLRGRGI